MWVKKPALTYNLDSESSYVAFLTDYYFASPVSKDTNWPDPPAYLTVSETIERDKAIGIYLSGFQNFRRGYTPGGDVVQFQYITPTPIANAVSSGTAASVAAAEAARIADLAKAATLEAAKAQLLRDQLLEEEAERQAVLQAQRDEAARLASLIPAPALPLVKLGLPPQQKNEPQFPSLPPIGVASDGQAPWDTQEDVTPSNQITPVAGTVVGAGYTPTVGKYPAGFETWLNLKVPNATTVTMILGDDSLLEPYLKMFDSEALANFQQGLPGTTTPCVPSFPNPYSYEKLDNPVWPGAITDGVGSKCAAQRYYAQSEPVNVFTDPSGGNSFTPVDSLETMLTGRGTDFLNMLAVQYSQTLEKIAGIAKARTEISYLIDTSKWDEIEGYLRDFDASRYAVKLQPEGPAQTVKASVIPGVDNTTALIALGVLFGIWFVMKKGKA